MSDLYFEAIQSGDLKIISENPQFKNTKDKYGMTPPCIASYFGNIAALKCLVDDIGSSLEPSQNNWTALHHAAYFGDIEIVKYLINKGLNPSALTDTGKTPLDYAVQNNNTSVIEYLKEAF